MAKKDAGCGYCGLPRCSVRDGYAEWLTLELAEGGKPSSTTRGVVHQALKLKLPSWHPNFWREMGLRDPRMADSIRERGLEPD